MMKRLYILIFLFAAALTSRAQTYSIESLYGKQVNRILPLYNLGIPSDTIAPPAAVAMYPHLAAKDSILYVWSPAGQRWRGIAGSSSGGGGSTYTFTAPLSNNAGVVSLTSVPWSLLSGKPTTLAGYGITDAVAYADTALILQGYVRKGTTGTGSDTLTFTQGLKQSGKTVVALNSAPMWNANRLQGYLVSPSQPLHGAFLKYDATAGMWVADTSGASGVGGTGAVSSVFGRTGAVTAQAGDYSSFYSPLGHTTNASTDITSGTLPIARGGTGLSTIGAVGQSIRVAADGTTLEYYTPAAGGSTYTAAYPVYINSTTIGIDTAIITTKGRVKAMIDSARLANTPTIEQVLTAGNTATKDFTTAGTITANTLRTPSDKVLFWLDTGFGRGALADDQASGQIFLDTYNEGGTRYGRIETDYLRLPTGAAIPSAYAPNKGYVYVRADTLRYFYNGSEYNLVAGTTSGGSSYTPTITTFSTSQTLSTSYETWVFTGSSAATATLPAISGNTGKKLLIINKGTAELTISGTMWDGSSTATLYVLPSKSITLQNDGTDWLKTSN